MKLHEVHKVSIPNGQIFIVQEAGDIHVTPKVTLKNVLFIPYFIVNLISTYKLVSESNLKILCDVNDCFF